MFLRKPITPSKMKTMSRRIFPVGMVAMMLTGLSVVSAWAAPELVIERVRALKAPAIMTLDAPFVVNVTARNYGSESAVVAAAYEQSGNVIPGATRTINPGGRVNLRVVLRATLRNTINRGTIFSTRVFLVNPSRRGRDFTSAVWLDGNLGNHVKRVSYAVRRAAPSYSANASTPDARLRHQRELEQRRQRERDASGLPDLVVEHVRIDYVHLNGLSQPGPGRARIRLTNKGRRPAAASVLRLLIEAEVARGASRQLAGRIDCPVRALGPGESIDLIRDIRGRGAYPRTGDWLWWRAGEDVFVSKRGGGRMRLTPRGSGVITAIADARGQVVESHEDNNRAVAFPLRPWVPIYHRDFR